MPNVIREVEKNLTMLDVKKKNFGKDLMESFSLPSWFLRLLGTLKREQYEPQAFFFFCLFTFFNFTSHTTPLSLSTFGRLLFKVSMDHPGGHLAVVLFLFVLVSMSTENNISKY